MGRERWLLILSAGISGIGFLLLAGLDRGPGALRQGDAVLGTLTTLDPTLVGLHRLALVAAVAGFALSFSLAGTSLRRHASAQRAIRTREDLLAVVSHDLKNPLGAVTLNADLVERLARAGVAGESVCRKAQLIRRSARHMEFLIRDLLDAAAIEAGRFPIVRARHRVEPLVDEALELMQPLARAQGLRLEWQGRGSLPELDCDRERVLQILGNLIGNAIKFTPEHGSIVVRSEGEAGAVRFSVTDTGCGIPGAELQHVFDRYWRSEGARVRSGAGLGLYIVKGITEAHGGKVSATSSVGLGSTFCFTLPAVRPEPPPDGR